MNSLKEDWAKKLITRKAVLAFKTQLRGNILIVVSQSEITKLEKGIPNENGKDYSVQPQNVKVIEFNPCDRNSIKTLLNIEASENYIPVSREFAKELYDHFLDLIEISENLSITSRAESWLKKEEEWKKL